MTFAAKIFIAVAVAFAVSGDYFLKRYGDLRSIHDLVLCLALWEVCALMWIIAYRQHVPLGRSTTFGAAIACTANVVIGALAFGESMSIARWLGVGFAITGIILVGA